MSTILDTAQATDEHTAPVEGDRSPHPRRGGRLRRALRSDELDGRLLFAVVPALVIVGVRTVHNRHRLVDDALIYLRYIRNFHEGHGLVYNPGSRFNGLSSPLFTYLQVLVTYVWKDYLAASAFVTGAALVVASVLGAVLYSRSRLEAALTAAVLPWLGFFYLTMGMETTLFIACIALALLLFSRDSRFTVIAVALAFATRGEGVFLGILPLLQLVRSRKLPPWWSIGTAAAIALVPLVVNQVSYGSPLAATAQAKRWQGESGDWGSGLLILKPGYLFDWTLTHSWAALITLLVLLAVGVVSLLRRPVLWGTVLSLGLVLAFYAYDRVPAYHWYYGPFLFFALAFAARGAAAVCTGVRDALAGRGVPVLVATLVGVVAAGALLTPYLRVGYRAPASTPEYYVVTGNWLREHTSKDSEVAAVEIGYIGWYSQRPIVDVLGLVNPYNAAYVAHRDRFSWLKHYTPDYIVVHDPLWLWEMRYAKALVRTGLYAPDPRFHYPGIRILRRDPATTHRRLVVFARHHGNHPVASSSSASR